MSSLFQNCTLTFFYALVRPISHSLRFFPGLLNLKKIKSSDVSKTLALHPGLANQTAAGPFQVIWNYLCSMKNKRSKGRVVRLGIFFLS